jgi:hypothetical protein
MPVFLFMNTMRINSCFIEFRVENGSKSKSIPSPSRTACGNGFYGVRPAGVAGNGGALLFLEKGMVGIGNDYNH